MESLVQSNDRDGKPMVYIMMRNDENLWVNKGIWILTPDMRDRFFKSFLLLDEVSR
jgi:hypothetical protein